MIRRNNVNMTPFNAANAPAARSLGQEIDLTVTYTLNPRMDVLLGYSHFFSGSYYKQTAGVPFRGDADFFYTQFQWNSNRGLGTRRSEQPACRAFRRSVG